MVFVATPLSATRVFSIYIYVTVSIGEGLTYYTTFRKERKSESRYLRDM